MASCSAWMVATMSPSFPVRASSREASSAALPTRSEPGALRQQGLAVEDLVLHGQELAAAGGEVPAAVQTHGLAARGPVERLGHRGPPVDDQRVVVLVGDGDATDVEALAAVGLVPVDATEHQRGVADVELGQAAHDALVDDLALEAGLVGAPPADLDHAGQARRRTAAGLEGLMGPIEVRLFGFQIGIAGHGEQTILPAPPAADGAPDLSRSGRDRCARRHAGPAGRHHRPGRHLEPLVAVRPLAGAGRADPGHPAGRRRRRDRPPGGLGRG